MVGLSRWAVPIAANTSGAREWTKRVSQTLGPRFPRMVVAATIRAADIPNRPDHPPINELTDHACAESFSKSSQRDDFGLQSRIVRFGSHKSLRRAMASRTRLKESVSNQCGIYSINRIGYFRRLDVSEVDCSQVRPHLWPSQITLQHCATRRSLLQSHGCVRDSVVSLVERPASDDFPKHWASEKRLLIVEAVAVTRKSLTTRAIRTQPQAGEGDRQLFPRPEFGTREVEARCGS